MPAHVRIAMVGGATIEVDDHELAIVRATAEAALKGEATPIISVMVRAADGTTIAGPMINVLQITTIEQID